MCNVRGRLRVVPSYPKSHHQPCSDSGARRRLSISDNGRIVRTKHMRKLCSCAHLALCCLGRQDFQKRLRKRRAQGVTWRTARTARVSLPPAYRMSSKSSGENLTLDTLIRRRLSIQFWVRVITVSRQKHWFIEARKGGLPSSPLMNTRTAPQKGGAV